jgi:ribosomal protein S18 acetylase RimI-like enzyme
MHIEVSLLDAEGATAATRLLRGRNIIGRMNLHQTASPTCKTNLAAHLRTAASEDIDLLVPFINRSFVRDNDFKTTERTNHAQVAEYLRKGTFLIMEELAQGTREILGLVYTELRANSRGYIGMVAVNPDRQSAGLGTLLLEAGERLCLEHRCKVIEISVINRRPDLIAWYKRRGYKITGEAPYHRPEILILPCHFILMEKDWQESMSAVAQNVLIESQRR